MQDIHRQLQLAQLKIAREIKRICEENNINYFLDAGSMLGAVRHKGFIPWDDDMDIGMLKKDYEKFLEIAPTQLGEEFFLDNYVLNNEYGLVFSKVRLKNTIYVEKLGATNAKHQEVFVDVFPYFYRPENNKKRKIQSIKLRILSQIFMAQSDFHVWKGNHGISKLKFLPIIIMSKLINKRCIYKYIEKLYNQCKDSKLVGIHDGICYDYWFYNEEYLKSYIDIKFENEYFKIPKKYDIILRTIYGNYMELPPIEQRRTHEIIRLDLGNNIL